MQGHNSWHVNSTCISASEITSHSKQGILTQVWLLGYRPVSGSRVNPKYLEVQLNVEGASWDSRTY